MHPAWNIRFAVNEIGAVVTKFVQNMALTPRYPAYEDPARGYNMLKEYLTNEASTVQLNDVSICARVLHKLASQGNEVSPSFRLALGADSWAAVQAELEIVLKEHEAWKTVAESSSRAENVQARDFVLKATG